MGTVDKGLILLEKGRQLSRQMTRQLSWDADMLETPDKEGFIPPWEGWDFNEWENCTDTEILLVSDQIDKV